jgi:RNA ligase
MRKQNRIVVNYDSEENDLILLAVKDIDKEYPLYSEYFNAFNRVKEVFMQLEQLRLEQMRPEFINEEGFVVKYKNGFRVKLKYKEYCRLHKTISNVNEKFVWEFLSEGKSIEQLGENIPDETFQFIRDMAKVLVSDFDLIYGYAHVFYDDICRIMQASDETDKKSFALRATSPNMKKFSGMLFRLWDGKEIDDLVWKYIKPKYEKGESGFSSFKGESDVDS